MTAMKELVVKVTGQVTESNFDEYKQQLIAQIQSANKELETDEDFVEAESNVKLFKAAEDSIVEAKAAALEQAADIQKLFADLDEVSEEARQARLSLNRQITAQKEKIKSDLVESAELEMRALISELKGDFKIVNPLVFVRSDFEAAIKGKKKIDSMREAIDQVKDEICERITGHQDQINNCREILNDITEERKSLFQDEKALLSMEPALLKAEIGKRIATAEADELKRKEQERLEKEAEDKAAAEAEAKRQANEKNSTTGTDTGGSNASQSNTVIQSPPTSGGGQPPIPETADYVISITIHCSKERAKEYAQQFDRDLSNNPAVKKIGLRLAE